MAAGAGNVISGNSIGLTGGIATFIAGNKIGTDITGTVALPNTAYGVVVNSDSTVGGTAAGAGNLISGNATGILEAGTGDLIEGNLIGTNATGLAALGNTRGGIDVRCFGRHHRRYGRRRGQYDRVQFRRLQSM